MFVRVLENFLETLEDSESLGNFLNASGNLRNILKISANWQNTWDVLRSYFRT